MKTKFCPSCDRQVEVAEGRCWECCRVLGIPVQRGPAYGQDETVLAERDQGQRERVGAQYADTPAESRPTSTSSRPSAGSERTASSDSADLSSRSASTITNSARGTSERGSDSIGASGEANLEPARRGARQNDASSPAGLSPCEGRNAA